MGPSAGGTLRRRAPPAEGPVVPGGGRCKKHSQASSGFAPPAGHLVVRGEWAGAAADPDPKGHVAYTQDVP